MECKVFQHIMTFFADRGAAGAKLARRTRKVASRLYFQISDARVNDEFKIYEVLQSRSLIIKAGMDYVNIIASVNSA